MYRIYPIKEQNNNNKMKKFFLSLTLLSVVTYSCSQDQKENIIPENKTLLFMEEEIQKVNVVQADRGSGFNSDVKSEFFSLRTNIENAAKSEKLQIVMRKTAMIDSHASKLINYIDQIKYQLINESGEDKKKIILAEKDGVYPDRLNLYNITSPGTRSEIKDSIKLFRQIVAYRDSLIYHCANYDWNSKSYRLANVGSIKNYSNQEEFNALLDAKLNVETYNYREDKYVLKDLYVQLHNSSMNLINQRNNTLLTNLCLLTALQQDILSSRALALANWKSKVSTGEYSFDSITTIVEGPEKVKLGSPTTYKVFIAAKDSEQRPEIVIDSNKDIQITYNEDGTYSLTTTPDKIGTTNLSGTISITNKSGLKRVDKWEKTIIVE